MEKIKESNSRIEQISQITEKVKTYHNMLGKDLLTLEKHESDISKIFELGTMISKTYNINPARLVFWHMLIGSTLGGEGYIESEMELDTPNNDIARFVDELLENN